LMMKSAPATPTKFPPLFPAPLAKDSGPTARLMFPTGAINVILPAVPPLKSLLLADTVLAAPSREKPLTVSINTLPAPALTVPLARMEPLEVIEPRGAATNMFPALAPAPDAEVVKSPVPAIPPSAVDWVNNQRMPLDPEAGPVLID